MIPSTIIGGMGRGGYVSLVLLACGGRAQDCKDSSCPVEPAVLKSCTAPQLFAGGVLETNKSPQERIDNLEGCTHIDGDLRISGFEGVSLAPLHDLRTVSGRLMLSGRGTFVANAEALQDMVLYGDTLEGLENLKQVDGLSLSSWTVQDLSPLDDLQVISSLFLSNCPNLRELNASISVLPEARVGLEGLLLLETIDGLTVEPPLEVLRLSQLPQMTSPDGQQQLDALLEADR